MGISGLRGMREIPDGSGAGEPVLVARSDGGFSGVRTHTHGDRAPFVPDNIHVRTYGGPRPASPPLRGEAGW